MPAGGSTANWNTLAAAIMEGLCLCQRSTWLPCILISRYSEPTTCAGHWESIWPRHTASSQAAFLAGHSLHMQAANSQSKI